MSKVTFTTEPMVLVTMKREKNNKDRELYHRLFDFMRDQHIDSVYPTNSLFVWDEQWDGFYTAEDAEKIKTWLLEQGVEPEEK